MDIAINISISVPDDGTKPIITVNEVEHNEEELKASELEPGDSPHDFDNERSPEEKRKPRNLDLPEQSCVGCGVMFKPLIWHQKFHNSHCKDGYNHQKYKEEHAKKGTTIYKSAHKDSVKPEPIPCLYCGTVFQPSRKGQKFDKNYCGDKYRRNLKEVEQTAKSDDRIKPVKKEKKETTSRVKTVEVGNIPPVKHIPMPNVSTDSYYRQQLKKAAQKSPTAYGKYLTSKDLKELETS